MRIWNQLAFRTASAEADPGGLLLLDDELSVHVLVPIATEDVAEIVELARLVRRERDTHDLSWIDVGAHVEVRQAETMLPILARNLDHDGRALLDGDLLQAVFELLHRQFDGLRLRCRTHRRRRRRRRDGGESGGAGEPDCDTA